MAAPDGFGDLQCAASPAARVAPVEKTVGSVTFMDPYAWLQDDSPEALRWMWEQDALAQAEAQSWPQLEQLKAAIAKAGSGAGTFTASAPRRIGSYWFWTAPSSQSPYKALWISESLDVEGRVLVESTQLASSADQASGLVIYTLEPSPNGEYIAVSVAPGGSMFGVWRIIETASGRVLDLEVPADMYNASPGWLPDGSGFLINDRAEDGRHRLRFIAVKPGTAARPDVTFEFAEVPADVPGLTPEVSPDGRWVIGRAGPSEQVACVLGDLHTGKWRRFLPEDHEGECTGAWWGSQSYVARVHGTTAPHGRVVVIPIATSRDLRTWQEIVPQSEAVVRALTVVRDRVVVVDLHHISVRFRLFDLDGRNERVVPLQGPGNSMIAVLLRRFDRSDELTFDYATFTRPITFYHCDVVTGALRIIGKPGREQKGITVTQRFAESIDRKRIPYFLIHRGDVDISRAQPTLLTGYGGFNVAWLPMYLAHLVPFVRSGGVIAHANLRGGGEYGKDWHEAGRLACKWNTFLDLFAVAEELIAQKVTTSNQLAMTGMSNGGLLAGAAIAHRPDLFRAVVPLMPLLDQMEPLPADPTFDPVLAVFLQDYGDPTHPVMSKVLYSYSPYHNIKAGVAYPAVLQVFGEADIGCMPFHGRKFTARLQAASTSQRPVRMRVWKKTGHFALDDDLANAQAAEWLAFIMRELDMKLTDVDE